MAEPFRDDIVLLFDYYFEESERLHKSFVSAGYDFPAVVIEDDGFLPDGVESVYSAFLGDYSKSKDSLGRPRYFNEIKIPRFWEIKATAQSGTINNLYKERGRIFYRDPKYKRFVKAVDWLDENGVVRSSDFYNKYGVLYARMCFNKKGERVNKSFFTFDGKEAIHENYLTGDIIINDGDIVKIFKNKTDLVIYFLEKQGYVGKSLYINSLSTPFFVSQRLSNARGMNDVLFWQEPKRNDIPGNMQMIFNGQSTRVAKVLVQKKAAYDKLIELGAKPVMTGRLGFIYQYEKENTHGKQALICTNSDQIERLEEIVKGLPELTFHICAVTEMSSKLHSMSKYDNVKLYPGVKYEVADDLFRDCDYYFDINHQGEILSAVSRAFLNNQAIVAFRETMHNGDYVAENHIYAADDYEKMIADVKRLVENDAALDVYLKEQRDAALSEDIAAYKAIL